MEEYSHLEYKYFMCNDITGIGKSQQSLRETSLVILLPIHRPFLARIQLFAPLHCYHCTPRQPHKIASYTQLDLQHCSVSGQLPSPSLWIFLWMSRVMMSLGTKRLPKGGEGDKESGTVAYRKLLQATVCVKCQRNNRITITPLLHTRPLVKCHKAIKQHSDPCL